MLCYYIGWCGLFTTLSTHKLVTILITGVLHPRVKDFESVRHINMCCHPYTMDITQREYCSLCIGASTVGWPSTWVPSYLEYDKVMKICPTMHDTRLRACWEPIVGSLAR